MNELRVAAFVSGGGTTLAAIGKAIQTGQLKKVKIVLVVHNKLGVAAVARAKAVGVDTRDIIYVPRKNKSKDEFGEELLFLCKSRGVDFVGQYGWLPMTPEVLIGEYSKMIVNQHPGPLDPLTEGNDFGGQGMHGIRVSAARLAYVTLTGRDRYNYATVHRVTPREYDRGEVLCERSAPVLGGDTPETLQQRLFPEEYAATIEVLDDFAKGRPRSIVRPKHWLVRSEHERTLLDKCKADAIAMYP